MPSIGGRPRPLKSPPPITVEDSAEDFLRALPNVRRGELTAEDQKCSICLEPFGTTPSERGVIERPKRLPCGHVVGSECIHTWVSPNLGNKNSCPICRYRLYGAHPGPSIELDDTEDSDELPNTDDAVDGSVERGAASGSDDTEYVPGELMRDVLTHSFEDFMLYRLLVDSNAQLPLNSDGHICGLNTTQEADLLFQLSRRRAFDQPRRVGGQQVARLSDQEMWDRMMDKGYYYKPDYDIEESGHGGGWFPYTYRLENRTPDV